MRLAITHALQIAFDALPETEKPEYKVNLGMAGEFGQHKVNLENPVHIFADNTWVWCSFFPKVV